jgi:hypothetical protein
MSGKTEEQKPSKPVKQPVLGVVQEDETKEKETPSAGFFGEQLTFGFV